jgi:DNA modification methylase
MIEPFHEVAGGRIRIYLGDCREHEDVWTQADVLVVDPPYGINRKSKWNYHRHARIGGDKDTSLRDGILEAWGPDKPALVFGSWRVPKPDGTVNVLVWDKGDSPGQGDIRYPWGNTWEEIYVLGPPEGFKGRRGPGVLKVVNPQAPNARPDHPTPKPVELMELLVAKTAGEVIADPCAGSGSTLVAAMHLGRGAIGFETVEKYAEITARRLEQQVFDFGDGIHA